MVGGVHGRVCVLGGACMAGVMHDRGVCMAGRHEWLRACMAGACMPGKMATAADGMHPTGMHSCLS